MSSDSAIINTVAEYYTETVAKHGATARGVDWSSDESQKLRFAQLGRIFEGGEVRASVLDYGSGWGALLEYIDTHFPALALQYTGYDIVPSMLDHARTRYPNRGSWAAALTNGEKFDYVLASGVLNVRQSHTDLEWWDYVVTTLIKFDSLATKGFAFNMLTSYSDQDKMRDYLYYANPGKVFELCKQRFSKQVALLHDYPLYEFTILVRK